MRDEAISNETVVVLHDLASGAAYATTTSASPHRKGASESSRLQMTPIHYILPIAERDSSRPTVHAQLAESGFVPRTALGKRLLALRNKAIAAGLRLLNEEEVLEEIRRRRGELNEERHKANLP